MARRKTELARPAEGQPRAESSDEALAAAQAALLAWYDQHKRDLPWRKTQDPYAIWLSEVMCQQTRVDTVVPYWQRFLTSFPSIQHLADASEDDVLGHWSGLGYYRRARMLQKAAKHLVAEHAGQMPEAREDRLAIPGVGPYTAGAIGSIAFGKTEPIVDGNVTRVFSRFFGIAAPIGTRESDGELWKHAESFADHVRPGDMNQAIMELGATHCAPKSPSCEKCPIASLGCAALARGEQDVLPVARKKSKVKSLELFALVSLRTGVNGTEVLLERSSDELFGGLWGVPLSYDATESAEHVGKITHVLSHRRLHVSIAVTSSAPTMTDGQRWVSLREIDERTIGTSTLTRKILNVAAVG